MVKPLFKLIPPSVAAAAHQESYRRSILSFERQIETFRENFKNTQDFIEKLQTEKTTTTDKQRLLQIEVDITYLQKIIQEIQPEILIERYERQLLSHKKIFLDRKKEKVVT